MTRLIYVLVLVLCISTSFTLYILSYDSKNIKKEIIQIRNTIEAEKSDIETLHAELSLLSQPDRIQNLSNQFGLDWIWVAVVVAVLQILSLSLIHI